MLNKIKAYYANLTPQQRKKVNIGGLILVVLVMGYFLYGEDEDKSKPKQSVQQEGDTKYTMNTKILEKAFHERNQQEMRVVNKSYQEVQEEIKRLKSMLQDEFRSFNNVKAQLDAVRGGEGSEPEKADEEDADDHSHSLLPTAYQPYHRPPQPETPPASPTATITGGAQVAPVVEPKIMGAIKFVSFEPPKEQSGEAKNKRGGEVTESFYLPPSFVSGTLLSGMAAPVLTEAEADPIPALVRLKDIAQLPNRIKADLKGCFVLIGCTGSIATERCDCRSVSISCLSKTGESVIDTRVKGYLVDAEDSMQGIRGDVVWKMGALLARSIIPGAIAGAGQALQASTQTSMVSGIGVTDTMTNFSPEAIGAAALGAGHRQRHGTHPGFLHGVGPADGARHRGDGRQRRDPGHQ